MNILILCTGNSCRSQIAHGFLDQLTDDSVSVFSAGVEKHGLNKNAVKCMAEIGIDISNYTSNLVDEYINKQFDFIITVCDNAKKIHKDFKDPSKLNNGIYGTQFIEVRDQIKDFIFDFIKSELC